MTSIHNGAGIIITNENYSKFFVQRKDNTYPLESCRLCISLFGGACDPGEQSSDTIVREINEELTFNDIKIRPTFWRNFHLPGGQFTNSYDIDIFSCFLSQEKFDALSLQIQKPNVVHEGIGEIVNRQQLCKWFDSPHLFFASLDNVFKAFLSDHSS
ncbi:NUDIX domain-containing protein [Candidatus Uabimicrobium sp. HlEnr_7]|uniref:NUDIX domain-containing protein n=1 Tax=Candidatus Uabimicrobium helgolandensis TaxID=3095367 RepID=UPI003556A572